MWSRLDTIKEFVTRESIWLKKMKIIQVANLYDDGTMNTMGGRVYDPQGIMRTLGGGHAMSQPLIIIVEEIDEDKTSDKEGIHRST